MMNQMISAMPSKPKKPASTPPTIGPMCDEEEPSVLICVCAVELWSEVELGALVVGLTSGAEVG